MTRLTWDGVQNVRDVGGLKLAAGGATASNALIRSGDLDAMTPGGRMALDVLAPVRIIDLRSPHEIRAESPVAHDASYRHLPFVDAVRDVERVPEAEQSRADLYRGSLRRNGAHVARICTEIANAEDGPVVVHCKSGVDRTGMLVALLLEVADVDRDEIVDDYVANDQPSERDTSTTQGSPLSQPLARATMHQVLDYVGEFGGAAGYLRAHGVRSEELSAIRRRLT